MRKMTEQEEKEILSMWRVFERECNQFVRSDVVIAFANALLSQASSLSTVEPEIVNQLSTESAASAVPDGLKIVGYYHKADDPHEDDFFFADAINGDCPACHPCYVDASVTVNPTPVEWRVPDGWKLVPIEPTEEMVNSALNCQECDPDDGPDSEVYYSYKAMIETAPTPPTKSEPSKDTCNHEWVSARNEVIKSGSICIKCYAMSAKDTPSNDHIVNGVKKEKVLPSAEELKDLLTQACYGRNSFEETVTDILNLLKEKNKDE